MIMQVDIEWPSNLPLPLVDYQGSAQNGTIFTSAESIVNEKRSRFERTNAVISVSWNLSVSEYYSFKSFHDANLGNGSAQFSLPLRYPLNSELTEWMVRFAEAYNAEYQDGRWNITASLDVVNPVVFGV